MTGTAVAHGGATTPDGVLVQEAAAGSGVSYGALYDRYATQVFNYSLRLTGSPDDAADATQEAFVNVLRRLQEDDRPVLDFSSYLFAAARHESYALMRVRARVRPSDTPPEEPGRLVDVETDPERAALLRDTQEAVQEANAQLAPRHREVLALREVAGRSYDEIAEIMGISPNAAAQLIFRARAKLREALTAGAVASVVATSDDCEWAQLLLNRVQDGEPVDEADREWLEEHLDECGSCQTANRMLLEAGASYRLWLPVALLAGMRADTLTAAGGVLGVDWSGVAAPGQAAGSSAGGAGTVSGRRGCGDRGGGNRLHGSDGRRDGPEGQLPGRDAGGGRALGPGGERSGPPGQGEEGRGRGEACCGASTSRSTRRGKAARPEGRAAGGRSDPARPTAATRGAPAAAEEQPGAATARRAATEGGAATARRGAAHARAVGRAATGRVQLGGRGQRPERLPTRPGRDPARPRRNAARPPRGHTAGPRPLAGRA